METNCVATSQTGPRDSNCTRSLAASTACTVPNYEILFPPTFSIAPHVLGAILAGVGFLIVATIVPAGVAQQSSTSRGGEPEKETNDGNGVDPEP